MPEIDTLVSISMGLITPVLLVDHLQAFHLKGGTVLSCSLSQLIPIAQALEYLECLRLRGLERGLVPRCASISWPFCQGFFGRDDNCPQTTYAREPRILCF